MLDFCLILCYAEMRNYNYLGGRKMNELQTQLQEVTDQLAQLDPNNRDNLVEIAGLEQKRAVLIMKIDDVKEQAAAQKIVIEQATVKAESLLDNFEIEGLTLSQLTVSSDASELVRGWFQLKLVDLEGQAANNLKLQELSHKEELRARDEREIQVKRQNEELQKRLDQSVDSENKLQTENGELGLRVYDAESKRDASVKQLEEAQTEIERLNSHIDDLRNEIAVGAQQAYKVVDIEGQRSQMKELADKIKASRIHVYDVVPDADFNPKNFTAKRADTGETETYNWTQANNYIELKDEAEVERFRAEHAGQSIVPDSTLDHAIEIQPIAEVTAPDVQFPTQGEVQADGVPVDPGLSSTDGSQAETVSRQEFEQLKATVKELCEVCNIAEVA